VDGTAFFFSGDSVLLPVEIPDFQMDRELPLTLLADFETSQEVPDVFTIPPADTADSPITGVSLSPAAGIPRAWRALPVRQTLSRLDSGMARDSGTTGRLLRSWHVAQWRRDSRFCGSCGTKNTDAQDELARQCPACGRLEFPRISPAVITIVVNDEGKALLAHNKKFQPGIYSLIAGFTEAGESLESTVAREIREEVNIEVKDIRYIISQPWPFPNSLMMGFSARYASGNITPDGIEIEDAGWFAKDALPKLPGTGTVSRCLIGHWLDGTL
jgi:NAD+ diphosphatase